MYIDADTINNLAKLVGSLAVLCGVVVAAYKYIDIQEEQTLLCHGIKACLQGLAEKGCDGPVHEALDKLDKHLNKKANKVDAA